MLCLGRSMALTALAESLERHAVDAQLRRQAGTRLTAEDAARRQRERRSKRMRGVYAALAIAGIRLTLEQKRAIDRVVRAHPELSSMDLSPPAAVERLIEHGVEFTDAQLALVVDEGSVSGLRRVSSVFEAPKRAPAATLTLPVARPNIWRCMRDWFGR